MIPSICNQAAFNSIPSYNTRGYDASNLKYRNQKYSNTKKIKVRFNDDIEDNIDNNDSGDDNYNNF